MGRPLDGIYGGWARSKVLRYLVEAHWPRLVIGSPKAWQNWKAPGYEHVLDGPSRFKGMVNYLPGGGVLWVHNRMHIDSVLLFTGDYKMPFEGPFGPEAWKWNPQKSIAEGAIRFDLTKHVKTALRTMAVPLTRFDRILIDL